MSAQLKTACDDILQRVTTVKDRVPGVVAMVTERSANIYEGAAGERIVGSGKAMTLDYRFRHFLYHQSDCRNRNHAMCRRRQARS